jgi:Ni2+-binding GTPase involved in maturation of urease and hydrogenase
VKIADVMTVRPLVVRAEDGEDQVRWLMDAARVHHLPLVDDGKLVGLWVETAEGPLLLLSPEAAYETTPQTEALDAMRELLAGREAVVVWREGDGQPVGVLTRTDALRLLRTALDQHYRRRRQRPVVARLIGPAGAGKSTLIMRSIERLRRCQVTVIQANPRHRGAPAAPALGPARVVEAPEVHWAKGFAEVLGLLPDAELILVEDRDGPPALGHGFGEDLQVLVVPALRLGEITPESLEEAAAVVITNCDRAPADFDLAEAERRLRARNAWLPIFAVGAADDPGVDDWCRWLEARVLRRGR